MDARLVHLPAGARACSGSSAEPCPGHRSSGRTSMHQALKGDAQGCTCVP